MLVFVDESGDPGWKIKKGSTPCLVVALVIFGNEESARACDTGLNLLRKELGLPGYFEFHFNKNKPAVRKAFLRAAADFKFRYLGIVINKRKLRGEGFKYQGSFYKYATRLVFERSRRWLQDASVVLDKRGSREFRRQVKTYLFRRLNVGEDQPKMIKEVSIRDSRKNNLLQLADMVAGAIARSFGKTEDARSYRKIIAPRGIEVRLWPK